MHVILGAMLAAARRLALPVVLTLATVAPLPAIAQDPDPTDALMASLLQAEDLPPGFETIGPEEGSPFDYDSGAFSRFAGRRVVSQAWSSETSGVVFDFRMELPSSEAAAGYLDEAEPTLSEADTTDLDLETDDPAIGEDARHYRGVTRIDEERAITFDNYLFRVGPVAAKVFVASVDLPEGEARRLAELAAERMAVFATAEIGPGTFEERSPVPSGAPGAAASGSPAASLPADPALVSIVPDAIALSCRPFRSGTAGEVAALSCELGDALIVYSRLADQRALDEAFTTVTSEMPDEDRTASCEDGPYLGPDIVGGRSRGHVACWEPPGGGSVLFWTDDENLLLAGILADSDDHGRLVEVWQRARAR